MPVTNTGDPVLKRDVKFLLRGGYNHQEEICYMRIGTINGIKAAPVSVSPFSESTQTRVAIVIATKHGFLI